MKIRMNNRTTRRRDLQRFPEWNYVKTLRILLLLGIFLGPAVSHGADAIVPGENLVVDGVPAIPKSLATEVGRYREFRQARFLDWHPVRKEMLISTRLGNTNQVHHVKFPGGARTQLTFQNDNVFVGRYQPTHGRYFVFSEDVGGNEQYQNYRYDLDTGAVSLLTDGESRNSRGIWSTRGARLAYTSTRRNGRDTDLYTMDPSEPKTDRLVTQLQGGGWSPLGWAPDERRILLQEYVSVNESYIWIVDAETGEKTLATPKRAGEEVSYRDATFTRDGKGLYVITDEGSEFRRLAYLEFGSNKLSYLSANRVADVNDYDLSTDRMKIAFVTNEEGTSKLYLLNIASRKITNVANLPLGIISNVKWHRSGKHLGFTLSAAQLPAEAFSLDVNTGKLERWTYSETGGLRTESFVMPELIRWKSFDGRMISGFLYRRPKRFGGKSPVIIDIHGGPEGQFRPRFLGASNYFLNELGVAMIFPNIRGSSGYGKTFLQLDNGFLRVDAYKDIGALLDWVQSRADLDPNRVLVTGGSYGGHMSLAVSYLYSDRLACSVDIVGPSNLVTFLQTTADYRRDLRRVEYGDERDPKMRAFLDQTAPLTNADKIKKPIFVVQGKNDPRVPLAEAEQLVAAVKKNGTPVWYLMAKDEGHGFAKKNNADFLFYATVMFMKECLLK
jgi:dipeptidyl aminopeptidase/acylaminoacyl peptidase